MRSRFVRPETRRLELSDGDWITVKARLTAGEQRDLFARTYRVYEKGDGSVEQIVDFGKVGIVRLATYLVDWSFPEFPIRNVPIDAVEAAIRNLETADFAELLTALDAHEAREAEAFAALKKTTAGVPASPPIWPSPDSVTGAMSGSGILIPMSTGS